MSELSVPLMVSHVEQVIVFADRIDIYLDFLQPLRPVIAMADIAQGKRIFNLCRTIESPKSPRQTPSSASVSMCRTPGREMHILNSGENAGKLRVYKGCENYDAGVDLINIEDDDGILWFDEVYTVRRTDHRNREGYTEQEVGARVYLTM